MKDKILAMGSSSILSPKLQLLVLLLFSFQQWKAAEHNLQPQLPILHYGHIQITFTDCALLKKFLLLHFCMFNLILQAEQRLASFLRIIILIYLLCKIK